MRPSDATTSEVLEGNNLHSRSYNFTKFMLIQRLSDERRDDCLPHDISRFINYLSFITEYQNQITIPTPQQLQNEKNNHLSDVIFSIQSSIYPNINFMVQASLTGPYIFESVIFTNPLEINYKTTNGALVNMRPLKDGKFIDGTTCYVFKNFLKTHVTNKGIQVNGRVCELKDMKIIC